MLDIPGMSDFRSVGRAFNRLQGWVSNLSQQMSTIPTRMTVDVGASGGAALVSINGKSGTSEDGRSVYNAKTTAGDEIEVIQGQIDSGETIPSGTNAIAIKAADGKWYMQVPVWL